MITKKKLLAEINRIEKAFVEFKMNTQLKVKELEDNLALKDKAIFDLKETLADQMDCISGKEAAEMLGWNSYMKASWLTEKGIAFTQDDNGTLHISRKAMEKYIQEQNKD